MAIEMRAVQQDVDAMAKRELGIAPQQRVPWGDGFATAKSRKWYFANKVHGKRGGHYLRTGRIEQGWGAKLDRRSTDNLLTVYNRETAAAYVYGPGNPNASYRQTPGHIKTGWGRGFDAKFRQIADYATVRILDAFDKVVDFVLKGGQ